VPDPLATFVELRPMLFGVAYRMLGSVAEAEDIVQEAYLRWQAVDPAGVDEPRRFLTTVVVRLAVDQLRSARSRRERYVGPWLPEPLVTSEDEPARMAELSDSLTMAFLVLLEELSPAERAAFVLHDVFDFGYGDIANMLDRQEPACRQLVARSRRHIDARRQRYDADRHQGEELTRRFLDACVTGDVDGLMELLAADVTVWTDGGGKVSAARRPIVGSRKAARFLVAVAPEVPPGAQIRVATVNAAPGVVVVADGRPYLAMTLDVLDGAVVGVRVVSNPDKLSALDAPVTAT
jgi:RNA polymerase sigma-70 factor (ECF subfamily)